MWRWHGEVECDNCLVSYPQIKRQVAWGQQGQADSLITSDKGKREAWMLSVKGLC